MKNKKKFNKVNLRLKEKIFHDPGARWAIHILEHNCWKYKNQDLVKG